MQFINFTHQGRNSFGTIAGGGVIDLGARLGLSDLGQALRRWPVDALIDEAGRHAADLPAALALDAYRPVVADPELDSSIAHSV